MHNHADGRGNRALRGDSDLSNLVAKPPLAHTALTYHRTWETGLGSEIRVTGFSPDFFAASPFQSRPQQLTAFLAYSPVAAMLLLHDCLETRSRACWSCRRSSISNSLTKSHDNLRGGIW